jgi:hypothetical protein
VKNKYSLQYTITVQYEIEVEKYNANLHSLIRRLGKNKMICTYFSPKRIPTMKGVPWMPRGTRNRDKAIHRRSKHPG